MNGHALERQVLKSIENARKSVGFSRSNFEGWSIQNDLKDELSREFSRLNRALSQAEGESTVVCIDDVRLETTREGSDHGDISRSAAGLAMIFSGQPVLRKRFVMAGSAAGTSLASKYLSKALPQKMPMRILGTKVFGRAVGRAVPLVGWTLLAVDVVELLIISTQSDDASRRDFLPGGGGVSGGGGASGAW